MYILLYETYFITEIHLRSIEHFEFNVISNSAVDITNFRPRSGSTVHRCNSNLALYEFNSLNRIDRKVWVFPSGVAAWVVRVRGLQDIVARGFGTRISYGL